MQGVALLHTLNRYANTPKRYTHKMDAIGKTHRIVGAALRALVNSGANDAAIGQFAAEHSALVASELQESQPTEVVATRSLDEVVAAVVQVLENRPSSVRTTSRAAQKMRVTLTFAGQRTSVTLSKEVMDRYIASTATGRKGAMRNLSNMAKTMPESASNRSQYMENAMIAHLESLQNSAAARH